MKKLGAPVALVVTFGRTTNLVAPSNVGQVVNYHTGHTLISKGAGFKGSISNINLNSAADINHLNIEKSNRLHASVISRFQATAGRQRRASPSAAVRLSGPCPFAGAPSTIVIPRYRSRGSDLLRIFSSWLVITSISVTANKF